MKEEYFAKNVESFVQNIWHKKKTYKVLENQKEKKYYCLSMLPYPSGSLHMGHIRNYTIGDVISRYHRMLGENVLQPIGWDAFGLPAENAALKNNIPPAVWTKENINVMKRQLKSMGFAYDWSREITTCSPDYYKWEQWFFIKILKKGLVYKKKTSVNWCPNDKTVLANEQVINGLCWRCEAKTEKKKINQWFIRITKYAEELLNDLKELDWPDKVKKMQKNWIGRSEGVEIFFDIIFDNKKKEKIAIYTTRHETIMGVTYIGLSIDHPLTKKIFFKKNQLFKDFIKECNSIKVSESDFSSIEKKGINTGIFAIHPISKKKIPVWITNFVLKEYGTGAIMGVPAHDQRDWEFAKKYGIKIKSVILNNDGSIPNIKYNAQKNIEKNNILFNSDHFNDLNCTEAAKNIFDILSKENIIFRKIKYRLRDWSISRQRYWGAPIPVIYLKNGKIVTVPESELPVILPENIFYSSKNFLKTNYKWQKIFFNGEPALREIDTFDTFIESSWYYIRYTCANYKNGMVDTKKANYWLPIDQYIGGIEHAIMHLMYFRFFHKMLRDIGLVCSNEPAKKLLCQGMVLNHAFYYKDINGQRNWISPSEVHVKYDQKGNIIKAYDNKNNQLIYDGISKMSKSKNNGIDPSLIIQKYGADTLRLFIMFAAPVELSIEWKESGIIGAHRFLKKIWSLTYQYKEHIKKEKKSINLNNLNDSEQLFRFKIHKTIEKVTHDFHKRQSFNTAIASIMELTNEVVQQIKKKNINHLLINEALSSIILMLYPFTPHICYVLWQSLENEKSIDYVSWPTVDKQALQQKKYILIVQINGKMRFKINVNIHDTRETITKKIFDEKKLEKYFIKHKIKKTFYLPRKIINFVLE
ncbi:leucine--tRNA ligase [Candidatus Tachikawaea gelatinosa]|uniref:Leucine--tRNA ligase n=1 Tax=Candidatus Tachikawaea gelatinosa TaxID=1410383 RepID=A0A090ALI0_9ENTR|nr:leucine--tRNA ligase [Candidatus Tachikawaea gelatinosa]BAP58499.1 leucine--tRNA ligase [Candidatus Tachikawaea gelatinosa]